MSSNIITALAILKVNWDIGRDYLEAFVMLVVECIRQKMSDVISLPDLQKIVNETFGLQIPLNPLKQILKRAAKQGFLYKENRVYYCNKEACEKIGFNDTQRKVTSIFESITKKLINFARDKYSTTWTQDEAMTIIHDFLRNNSLSLLYNFTEDIVEEIKPSTKIKPTYIFSNFIHDAQINDKQLVEDIEVILKGNLLANSVFLPDVGHVRKRFQNTKIYLDTSIIAYAAGYAGPNRATPCQELLMLLKEYGAELYCFQQTYDEVCGILDACASRLRKGKLRDAYGPSIEYFIQAEKSASDVELMITRLPQKMRNLDINVVEKPSYEKKYQIDESEFENALENEIHYNNPRARIHDVDCISSIARLRKGHESIYPENSKALFVSTNSALARISRHLLPPKSVQGAVACCITDYALGNLLWLKNPIKAPDLPRQRLIADVFAAMQPSEHLWKRYLIEIAKLEENGTITADDYYLLRYSMAAKSALMDLIQGEDDIFSEGSIKEILELAKENIKSELKATLSEESEKRKLAEKQLIEYQEEKVSQKNKLFKKANTIAKIIKTASTYIIIILIIFGIYLTMPSNFPNIKDSWIKYLAPFGLFVFLLFTFFNLIKGITVSRLMKQFESLITSFFYRRLLSFSELEKKQLKTS